MLTILSKGRGLLKNTTYIQVQPVHQNKIFQNCWMQKLNPSLVKNQFMFMSSVHKPVKFPLMPATPSKIIPLLDHSSLKLGYLIIQWDWTMPTSSHCNGTLICVTWKFEGQNKFQKKNIYIYIYIFAISFCPVLRGWDAKRDTNEQTHRTGIFWHYNFHLRRKLFLP